MTPQQGQLVVAPCPTCGAPGGFHDDGPHSLARAAIPAHLRWPSNNSLRAQRRADPS